MKLLPLLLLLAAGSALADDAALLRCRAISDVPSRVACYDAIPVAATAARPAAAPVAATPAAPAAPAAAAAATTPALAAAPASAADPAWAALPAKPVLKADGKPADAVETSIEGTFMGWVPGQRIRFANGQVWRIEDGSTEDVDLKNPKAQLRKGLFGAVYLDIEGAARAPRVKRVQ